MSAERPTPPRGSRHLRAVPAAEERQLSAPETAQLGRAQRAARWVGLIIPLGITAALACVLLLWLPRMPRPAATHWGISGEPDGFGSPVTTVIMMPAIALLLTSLSLLTRVTSSPGMRRPGQALWGPGNRLLPAIVLGSVVLLAVTGIGTSWVQLDAADARETGSTLGVLIASLVLGLGAGIVGYVAQPRIQISATSEAGTQPLPLAETEQAVWVGRTQQSRLYGWVVGSTLAMVLAVAVWLLVIEPVGGWIMLALVLLLTVFVAQLSWFTVRVDGSGVTARSRLGWPTFSVSAAEVARVGVEYINPLGEFGGWGVRWVPDATALVFRTGEALVVTRSSGKRLVLGIDDAQTAAELLSAAAERARQQTHSSDTGPNGAQA